MGRNRWFVALILRELQYTFLSLGHMRRQIPYFSVAALCVLQPALLFGYVINFNRFPDWTQPLMARAFPYMLLLWPIWGIILWMLGARKLRLMFPLILGAIPLFLCYMIYAFSTGQQ